MLNGVYSENLAILTVASEGIAGQRLSAQPKEVPWQTLRGAQ